MPFRVGNVTDDHSGEHFPQNLPRTELLQLTTSISSEAAVAQAKDKARYQSALAVCNAISNAVNERQAAFTNLHTSIQMKSTHTFVGMTKVSNAQRDEEIIARHGGRWSERATLLMQGITNLYTTASQMEAASLASGKRRSE